MNRYSIKAMNTTVKCLLFACLTSLVVYSCASVGTPSGGEEDLDPPKVVRSNPSNNQLNVTNSKIEVVLDELVKLDKPMDNIIITPPQKRVPKFTAVNNKVLVELKDSLMPNTTYIIDFTGAIQDYNEGNVLENYALPFSTGNVIDSLQISGKVLSGDNLEPVKGMYVGIHSNLSDTAFTKLPFLRISKTSETGSFTIKGVAPGKYKIYALNDHNRNYLYDSADELIAFNESIIEPSAEKSVRLDSVFRKDIKTNKMVFDSIRESGYTRFLPDNVVLMAFKSPFKRQMFNGGERILRDIFSVFFTAPQQLPKLTVLNVEKTLSEWTKMERTEENDTIKFWITDPEIAKLDTIKLEATYFKTDSLNMPQLVTEVKDIVFRKKKVEKKDDDDKKDKNKKGQEQVDSIPAVNINTNISSTFDVNRRITIEFDSPVKEFDKSKINLQHRKDTIMVDVDFELYPDSLNPRRYELFHKWIGANKYKLSIDSAVIENYSGLKNLPLSKTFDIKPVEKYGALYFNLSGLPSDSIPAYVELLDKSDKPVYKSQVKDGGALFVYIEPKEYYARLVIDTNGNGKWDTGDYSVNRQPEPVYYWNKSVQIKEYGEHEEDWNILSVAVDKQKPMEITKNKPTEKEEKRKKIEEREKRREREREEREGTSNNRQQVGRNSDQNRNQMQQY